MKKLIVVIVLVIIAGLFSQQKVYAQDPITMLIKEAIKKVIKAADLQIQRLQNKTIWLQNAQKTIENKLSKLKLDQISEWTEKQKNQYRDYYEELQKVKSLISFYNRIRNITEKQIKIVKSYKKTWMIIESDKHFNAKELAYMAKVYGGILEQSIQNMEQVYMVVNSFKTQMTDAKRLELIAVASDRVDENYYDLTRFNNQNVALSLQRAKQQNDVDVVRKLYGLQ